MRCCRKHPARDRAVFAVYSDILFDLQNQISLSGLTDDAAEDKFPFSAYRNLITCFELDAVIGDRTIVDEYKTAPEEFVAFAAGKAEDFGYHTVNPFGSCLDLLGFTLGIRQ